MASKEALVQALHRIHRFLDLLDVANVLSTCHTLRNDSVIATRVLEYNVHSQHFFQNCPLDWFHLTPELCIEDGHWQRCVTVIDDDADEDDQFQHDLHDLAPSGVDLVDIDMMEKSFTPESDTSPNLRSITIARSGEKKLSWSHRHLPWYLGREMTTKSCTRSQMINLIGLVERILLRCCYQPVVVADEVHVIRPVVLPLNPLKGGQLVATRKRMWKAEEIVDRLNRLYGDTGLRLESADRHRTCFSIHWDNIQVTESHVCCTCCDAFKPAVEDYRQTVELLYRRWLTAVESCRSSWRQESCSAKQLNDMLAIMREELLPSHGFFNETMAHASDVELMEFICTHTDMSHSFDVCPQEVNDSKRYNWTTVFHPTMRSVCHQLLMPLKTAMSKQLSHTARRFVQQGNYVHGAQQVGASHADQAELPCWSDIVTGAFPTGYLVGFYYITYRKDAPPPARER